MKREDLLDLNFDWRDESTFKKALKESGLSEKEKLRLRDERMHRLELEELKAQNSDYDDYDYDDDGEEPEDTAAPDEEEPVEEERPKSKNKSDKESERKKDKKEEEPGGLIVAIKDSYPARKTFVALALCVFMAIFPYISYMHEQPLTELTAKYFSSSSGSITDWFLFQKEFCLVIAAALLGLIFLTEEFFLEKGWKDIPLRKKNLRLPLILTGVYALLLIISGIMAEHKELVMMGIVKHYEGLLGTLGYLVLFLAAMNYFCDTKSLERFGMAMMLCSLAAGIFAVMEYKGHPLQETDFMAHLMAPADQYELASSLRSTSSNVHITFYNSNYFGSFCGLMFPLTAGMALGSKNIVKKALGLVAAAGLVLGAILSNSSGGLYAVAGGGVLLLLVYAVYWCRGMISRIPALVALLCAAAVGISGLSYMVRTNDDLAKRVDEVVNNGDADKLTMEQKREKWAKTRFVLSDIRQDGSSLVLDDYSGNTVTVECYQTQSGIDAVRFYDTAGEKLETHMNDDMYFCFDDERYKFCKFKFSSTDKLYIDLNYKTKLVFQYEDGKFKPYVHSLYIMEDINSYRGPELFRRDLSAFTGRSMIWGNTISFLDECIFIGKGCGNYICAYPQYDYVSLLEVYQTPAMVINKPHNWYLGVAVDSGIVSLLALLALLGVFLVKGFKTVVLHPVKDRFMHLRLGIYISVIAFMVVGMVNDSYVCVSPLFWFIFGVGWYAVSGNKVIKTDG